MNIQYHGRSLSNLITHTAWGITIHHWIFLLWKNRFKVGLEAVPKAFLITCNALFNAPFQVYEYYRFRGVIRQTEVRQPVFIIGHYRSGTTYLHYLLSRDPDFGWCSTYEGLTPNTFLTLGRISKALLTWAMPGKRPQDNMKSGASLPLEEEFALGSMSRTSFVHGYYFPRSLRASFDEHVLFNPDASTISARWQQAFLFFVQKLTFKNGGKRLLLKSPANTGRIKEILQLFPDARFIHLHRNPYEVYASTVHLYETTLPVLGFHRADNAEVEEFVFYGYENLYRKYLVERSLIPANQLIEVAYESLDAHPMETLQKIYQSLGLGSFERVYDRFKSETLEGYRKNRYDEIPSDTKLKIKDRWKFAFDAFGYPR